MVNRVLFLAGTALASAAAAQVSAPVGTVPIPPSQPAPTPTPTPVPVVSPTPLVVPPPVVPTTTATPEADDTVPRTTPGRRRPRATTAVPPRVAPTPAPSPSPTDAAPPIAVPTEAAPPPVVEPTPTPSPTIAAPAPAEGLPFWAIPAGLLGLLLIGAVAVALRRRAVNRREDEVVEEAPLAEAAPPVLPLARDMSPPIAPAPSPEPQFLEPLAPEATLAIDIAARRAGVNLLTATADVEITLRNDGAAALEDVRVAAQLTSAQSGQDAALAAFFAAPIARPVAPPFALAPGETRTVRTLMTLAREAITVLTAAERPMFVPVAAVNVLYREAAGAAGQATAAFAIGVEREGQAKLGPFWLDGPSRMHDRLGVRPHAVGTRG